MILKSAPSTHPPFPSSLRPLIILGAARSGTKLLRALLDKCDQCIAVPRSLNDLWRRGLSPHDSDRRSTSNSSPQIKADIRSRLLAFVDPPQRSSHKYLVEKTCANTLRVPFIRHVLPEAHFVHIIRDGRDAAVSAREKWKEGPSFRDVARKLRSLLTSDITSLRWHVKNWWAGADGLASWGPRYSGMSNDLMSHSMLDVCARQWRACVNTCLSDVHKCVPSECVTTVRYESLVRDQSVLTRLLEALEVTNSSSDVYSYYDRIVHDNSVGRWQHELTSEEQELVHSRLQSTLERVATLNTLSSYTDDL